MTFLEAAMPAHAALGSAVPAPDASKDATPSDCNCWKTKNAGIEKYGVRIAPACKTFTVHGLDLRATYGLPLARIDGKPLRRSDPKMLTISYCPFCGRKLASSEVNLRS